MRLETVNLKLEGFKCLFNIAGAHNNHVFLLATWVQLMYVLNTLLTYHLLSYLNLFSHPAFTEQHYHLFSYWSTDERIS